MSKLFGDIETGASALGINLAEPLEIHSNGGNLIEAFAIANRVRSVGINTINTGCVIGAAALILVSGKKVFAKPGTVIALRESTMAVCGSQETLQKAAQLLKKIDQTFVENVSYYRGIPAKDIQRMIDDAVVMNAEQALESKIIDEIL